MGIGGVELVGNGIGKLKAKAHDSNNEGILVIGFEQNIILKYHMNEDKRELLIASPFQNGGVHSIVALSSK